MNNATEDLMNSMERLEKTVLALRDERDTLSQLLATERGTFLKKEAELVAARMVLTIDRERWRALAERLAEALKPIPDALDDAITIYAPDECSKKTKLASYKRRASGGGTLAYFCDILKNVREVIAAYTAAVEGKKG